MIDRITPTIILLCPGYNQEVWILQIINNHFLSHLGIVANPVASVLYLANSSQVAITALITVDNLECSCCRGNTDESYNEQTKRVVDATSRQLCA